MISESLLAYAVKFDIITMRFFIVGSCSNYKAVTAPAKLEIGFTGPPLISFLSINEVLTCSGLSWIEEDFESSSSSESKPWLGFIDLRGCARVS